MTTVSWCERCGADLPATSSELPCRRCWTRTADDALAARLINVAERALVDAAAGASSSSDPDLRAADERARRAEVSARDALELLRDIVDPRAADRLRGALDHRLGPLRAAAARSLGRSGCRADAEGIEALLDDRDPGVRDAARVALAELGGPRAAEALAARLDGPDDEGERFQCTIALAWLGDRRALASARRFAAAALAKPDRSRDGPPHLPPPPPDERLAVRAMLNIGDEQDIEILEDRVAEDFRRGDGRRLNVTTIAAALALDGREPQPTLEAWLADRGMPSPWTAPKQPRPAESSAGSVPRLTLADLLAAPPSNDWPPAKFGGQPDWRQAPRWPVTADGRPLTFCGQLPLQGSPARTAYIFINESDHAGTWSALGDGNAVVVQPGPPPHLRTVDCATGPGLYERLDAYSGFQPRSYHAPYERFIRLEPGTDPPDWDQVTSDVHGAWDKIGGTPLFLQGPDAPPGDGWRYAFQFTAAWAGRELADGAQCYGFINGDGGGALFWQCH